MPTNEYEKAIEIANATIAKAKIPREHYDDERPSINDLIIAEALLTMHEELKQGIPIISTPEGNKFIQLQAALKEALDVIRFYADQMSYFDFWDAETETTKKEQDCGQRAREFIAKLEGKE